MIRFKYLRGKFADRVGEVTEQLWNANKAFYEKQVESGAIKILEGKIKQPEKVKKGTAAKVKAEQKAKEEEEAKAKKEAEKKAAEEKKADEESGE